MTDSSSDLRELVEVLYIRTADRKVPWRYDETSDTCEVTLGKGYVQVLGETDEDGDYFNYIRLLNSDKAVIEDIYGGTLAGSASPVKSPMRTGHQSYWELIRDLKSRAQRIAIGADEVLVSMLGELRAGASDLDEDVPF